MIDWTKPRSQLTKHFTIHDALYLPSWKIYHIPSEEEKLNIIKQAEVMEKIREFLGLPIIVSCWIRPLSVNCPASIYHGKNYNKFVKGSKTSAHTIGLATDWYIKGKNCDDIRKLLEFKLEEFDIYMENLPKSNWVHVNSFDGHKRSRFFIPY